MNHTKLKFKPLGIDTHQEHIIFMRRDCHVCVSEGFSALTRVRIYNGNETIVATLNVIDSELLAPGEISLSHRAAKQLNLQKNDTVNVGHLNPIESLKFVRGKIFGQSIDEEGFQAIISDIVKGNYSNIHLSAFITACAGKNLSTLEIVSLTKAMLSNGHQLSWDEKTVVDKHCIGGLPGNRTTPLIVSIVAALGLTMPKTSSRAITSPAGTADTMEVMAPVNLTSDHIKKVVDQEGGCIVWGGTASLSPADDILIKIEKVLDIDSEGQLIASVLSKKMAAGSTHVVIDMPVGETAKLRTQEAAIELKNKMLEVGNKMGLKIEIVISDGSQPVGRGIGPALEAMDILSVLRHEPDAPKDLRERAILLAGKVLEMAGNCEDGLGQELARKTLDSGKALSKFNSICNAQGGFREPKIAPFRHDVIAEKAGIVQAIDNRKLALIAKLAGAPQDKLSGILFSAPLGTQVAEGQTLFTIFAESKGELEYSLEYQRRQDNIIEIG